MIRVVIASSLLIIAVLLLRWLFRSKVSQRLIYGAWLLVALRLLIPIQFGEAKFSVSTMTQRVASQSKSIQQLQTALSDPVIGPSREEVYDRLVDDYLQENSVPETPDTPVSPDAFPEASAPTALPPQVQQEIQAQAQEQITGPTLSDIFLAVWLTGICAMAGWFLGANLLFLRRAKRGATSLDNGKIRTRISPNVPTPCLVGFFRPVIYLTPECAEQEDTRTHVLTHEKAHLRHGDHIWALVRCLCLCIYWFNPLVWVAAAQSRRDCELACDESALKKLGDDQRIAYGQTLLDIVTQSISPVHLLETATSMNETKKQLKERVLFIAKKPRRLLIASISMVLVATLITGCVFTGEKSLSGSGADTPPTDVHSSAAVVPVNGSLTKPGFKRVYLVAEASSYNVNGGLDTTYKFTYDAKGLLLTEEYSQPQYPASKRLATISRNEKGFVSTISYAAYQTGSTGAGDYNKFYISNYYNYTYNDAGRLTRYDFYNGSDSHCYTYTYDTQGRLVTFSKESSAQKSYTQFVYDAAGNLSRILNNKNTSFTFTYDSQGRLKQANDNSFEYDEDGHLIKESSGNFNLVYTWENGVLTGIRTDGTNIDSLKRSYTLDEYGNVTAITWNSGKRIEFKYIAVDLPEADADRALLYLSTEGPIFYLPNYCHAIDEYYLPYRQPTLYSWKTVGGKEFL